MKWPGMAEDRGLGERAASLKLGSSQGCSCPLRIKWPEVLRKILNFNF